MGSPPTRNAHERLFSAMDRAAIDPGAWTDVCDGLAALVGGAGTTFVPLRVRMRAQECPYSRALEEPVAAYLSGWTRRDYRGDRGFPVILARGVATDLDFSTPEQIRDCPFYNELLAPFGFKWCLALSFEVNGDVWAAVIQGRLADEPFGDGDKRTILRVRQPLAIAARRAASSGFARAEDWKTVLETAGRAVMCLNGAGRIVAASPAAEALLGDALQLRGGCLLTADPRQQHRLSALISAAVRHDPARPRPMPAPPVIEGPSGQRLHVDALPMPRDYQALLAGTSALLVLREVESRTASLSQLLKSRFGLTPAEIRLAVAMADGVSLQEASESLGLRVSTARVQLKSVFAKTDTHRQGELVALLARMA